MIRDEGPLFIEIALKDGRELTLDVRAVACIEHLDPVWMVSLKAPGPDGRPRVLELDADEVRPLLECVRARMFDPES